MRNVCTVSVRLWEVSVVNRQSLIEPFVWLTSKMTQPASKYHSFLWVPRGLCCLRHSAAHLWQFWNVCGSKLMDAPSDTIFPSAFHFAILTDIHNISPRICLRESLSHSCLLFLPQSQRFSCQCSESRNTPCQHQRQAEPSTLQNHSTNYRYTLFVLNTRLCLFTPHLRKQSRWAFWRHLDASSDVALFWSRLGSRCINSGSSSLVLCNEKRKDLDTKACGCVHQRA